MDWAMKERGHSQRRACGLVGMDPRVYRYRSTRGWTTGTCDGGCGSWLGNVAASGIGDCTSCWRGKGWW